MELDRISNLPDAILEKILSCLGLKEATTTSLLSSKWRYKSSTLQSLVFDDTCISTQEHATFTFVNIVDHVLLLHSAPIYKFKLSRNDELAEVDMIRWIIHLHRNAVVKEMTLHNIGGFNSIPSCFFSFQDIVYLELFMCCLKVPRTFKGFRSLKCLDLSDVLLPQQEVFEKLIGGSPLLEKLKLHSCRGFSSLLIAAPNLQHIEVKGAFYDFSLENASNLVDASLYLTIYTDQRGACRFGNLSKMFDHQLPHIQRLTMKGDLFKYLSIGVLPEKLQKPCQYLKLFSVSMCFDDPYQISAVLWLLRSSPVLQELKIKVDLVEDHSLVGEVDSCLYDNFNYANCQLRLVKITKISGVKSQLNFIKFLLSSSPVLERMTVQPATVDDFSNLVKKLLLFKRDSKHAELVLLDA